MATRKLTLVLDLDTGQFSSRVKSATGQLRVMDAAVDRTSNSFKRAKASGAGFGDTMRGIHHQLSFVHVVLAALTASVGGFTMALVKTNAEAQRSVMLLEGLSKSASRAGRQLEAAADFKFIRQMSKDAPFSMQTLTDAFVKLKSVGIDPTQGAMEALANGMAMFGGTDEQFHRATIAIQQMMGKGVISMEELRQQLGEAFPIAIKVMAKAAGMSIRDFVKEVSLGKIEAEGLLGTNGTFYAGMQAEADGAAARMMQTWGGTVSQIKTKLAELAYAIGGFNGTGGFEPGGFMSELTKGAKDFSSWLSDPDTINGAKEFGAALGSLVVDLSSLVSFLMSASPQIKILAGAFLAFKAVEIAKVALTGLVAMLGVTTGAQGTVISASAKMRLAEMAYQVEVLKGNSLQARSVAALAAKAQAEQRAAVAADVAAKKVVANLAGEQAAIKATILQLEAKRIAMFSSTQYADNRAAGLGRQIVGAGAASGPVAMGVNTAKIDAQRAAAQRALTITTTQLTAANAALAGTTGAVVAATTAAQVATARLTLGQAAAAIATNVTTVAVSGLNFVMSMLGGPVIAGLMLAIGAVMFLVHAHTAAIQASEAANADAVAATNSLTEATADTRGVLLAATGSKLDDAVATDELVAATVTAIGETNGMTDALVVQTEQLRANTLEKNRNALATAQAAMTALQVDAAKLTASRRAETLGTAGGRGGPMSPGGRTGPPRFQRGEITNSVNQMTTQWAIDDAEAALAEMETITTRQLANANLPQDDRSGSGNSSDGRAPRRTPAQNMADEIARMSTGRAAIDALISTLNTGSEAAADMAAKIAEIRREHGEGSISVEMEREAIAAAIAQENLGRAYDELKGIFAEGRDQSVAASEAYAQLGEGTDRVEISTAKFTRTMAQARAEIVRLDPVLAADAEAMAKLDATIAAASADFKFVQIATSARTLHEEMLKLADTSLDPNLAVWDAYRLKIKEIDALAAAAELLPSDTPERAAHRTAVMAEVAADRTLYTDRHLAETSWAMNEEISSIEEALMTTDQARQYAHDREIQRIMALTDVTKLSAEDRAKYEVQMTQLRIDAVEAAEAKFRRDSEGPMAGMLRDYQDQNARMKELNAQWLGDFMGMLRSGEANFGEFVLKILADYLMMLAEAKMAAILEKGLDAMMNIASAALGGGGMSFRPGTGAGTGTLSGMTGAGSSFNGGGWYGGMHQGGIAGGSATFTRYAGADMFADAKRYHTGGVIPGLRQGEVPIIAQQGEGVFTPEQMAAMGGSGGGVAIEFNLINESGQDLQASEGGKAFDGEKYIIDVIVANANRPGPLRTALKSSK